MTAPRVEPDVEVLAYARDVRAELADVPADRLAEVLDDLEEHLVEVAGEGGEPLTVRLGPPAEYAAELRRAAGLPGRTEPTGTTGAPGATWRAELDERLDRLRSSRQFAAVRDFLPELRPAWWVLRAWAPLVAVDAVLFGRTSFPVPSLGVSPLVGLVVTGAAITWSVRRGLRARRDPGTGATWLAVAVNGALALLAFVALVAVADQPEPVQAYDYAVPGPTTLTHEDGSPITNIHPYSSTGEPLSGVLLYDQDGRPIDNLAEYTSDGEEIQRLAEDPPAPANAYPQVQRELTYDQWGNPVWGAPSTAPESSPAAPSSSAPSTGSPVEPTPGLVPEPTP
ncbi:HAAS signaling domain-containing protein [Blastococcus sp. SYSU DS0619]